MGDSGMTSGERRKEKINWKWLLITIAVGIAPIAISFIFGWWWIATFFLLVTGLVACFAFPHELYVTIFTLFVGTAIAWLVASVLDSILVTEPSDAITWRRPAAIVAGLGAGILIPAGFWGIVLAITTKWILAISQSFDVSFGQAFRFVATRTFDTSQFYWIVENGEITVDNSKGKLSKLGGPGVLVVRPGNVVVLERGGKTTRIVDAGTYALKRFEFIKKPVEIKGIVDLRPQFAAFDVERVMTMDGIPLTITIGQGWQIEPKSVTDGQPESHFAGGAATTRVLGDPEYPVYEATIRKAIFQTTKNGWQGLFPIGPTTVLRDVVSTLTLDQLFEVQAGQTPAQNRRTVRQIEETVNANFSPSWAGVVYGGMDIRKIEPPPEVVEKMIERWKAPIESELTLQQALTKSRARVQEAQAERRAIIEVSEGQAAAIIALEGAKYEARSKMVNLVRSMMENIDGVSDPMQLSFMSVMQQITERVGQDERVALRYIEAMQAIVDSDGNKTFMIHAPNLTPGKPTQAQPGTPQPTAGTGLPGTIFTSRTPQGGAQQNSPHPGGGGTVPHQADE